MGQQMELRAAQPKQMGIDERRIVYEKIGDVYLDPKIGYSKGWSDKRVADDLGVPPAWVREVRDTLFGPEGSEELVEIRAQAIKLDAEQAALAKEQARLQGELSAFAGRIAALHARIAKFEAA